MTRRVDSSRLVVRTISATLRRRFYHARTRQPQDRRSPVKPRRRRADEQGRMLKRPGPMSNTERQRKFRESHPGYYARLQSRKRAAAKAAVDGQRLAEQIAVAVRANKSVLMLPAPAVVIELPGLNTIPANFEVVPVQSEPLPIPRRAAA